MKQGSYRIRWENLISRNVEEARLDVERRDIFVSSDLLSDSMYYTIHFDVDWQLDDFELTVDGERLFHCQRKMNGMWVDRIAKRIIEEFKGFEYFDLNITPLPHIMATKRLELAPGESQTLDVAMFDVAGGSYRAVKQTYTRLDDAGFLFQDETEERTIHVNEEGMITEEEGRFKMLDFQIW